MSEMGRNVVVLLNVVMLPNVVMVRIVIDYVQNLRLDLIDLAIDLGNRRGRRGVDAAHQGGFLTQESDGVVDILKRKAGNRLICNGVLETRLGRVQIIDDRLLVAGIDPAN